MIFFPEQSGSLLSSPSLGAVDANTFYSSSPPRFLWSSEFATAVISQLLFGIDLKWEDLFRAYSAARAPPDRPRQVQGIVILELDSIKYV